MLDAFIIEELRRREEAERPRADRPRLELPLEDGSVGPGSRPDEAAVHKVPERGVIVIDY